MWNPYPCGALHRAAYSGKKRIATASARTGFAMTQEGWKIGEVLVFFIIT